MISMAEFQRLDLRVGKIVAAEPIQATDRLTVTRQVSNGTRVE
jgi:tRNA-binding EMAP/Myf-like protein